MSGVVNLGPETALFLLRALAKEGHMTTRATTFVLGPYPLVANFDDVYAAFVSLAAEVGVPKKDVYRFSKQGLIVHLPERGFERLCDLIYVKQKLPIMRKEFRDRMSNFPSPLPSLFIGREKTQVRQIALVDRPPWPFHFLMELGGMIVVKTNDLEDVFKSLRQYLNNHPQFEVRVDAKECPDGTVTIFTYWFQELKLSYRRGNMNVPN